jgi:hypothetical protein
VTSDDPSFETATTGNIMITRVEADDPTPADNYYRRLNVLDNPLVPHKRTEPEVHYIQNDIPVVFYSQEQRGGDPDNCQTGVNKLMRAKTGQPFPN